MYDEHAHHSHKELGILSIIEMSTHNSKKKVSVSGSKIEMFTCKNEGCVKSFRLQASLSRHEKACKMQKKEESEPQDRSKDRINLLDVIYSKEITKQLGDHISNLFDKCLRDCNLTRLNESDIDELRRYQMILDGTVRGVDSIEYVLTPCLLALEEWRTEQSIVFDIHTIRKLMKVIDNLRLKSIEVGNKIKQQT